MKNFWFLLSIISLAFFSTCGNPQDKKPSLPLSIFFKNPDYIGLKISPNGKYLAFLKTFSGRLNLGVRAIASDSTWILTHGEKEDIYKFKWGDNDKIFYLKDSSQNENHHLYLINRKGGESKDLTPYANINVEWWDDDRPGFDKIYFSMNLKGPFDGDLYEYSIKEGKTHWILSNNKNEKFIAIKKDFKGVLRVVIASNGVDQSFFYREDAQSGFRKILETHENDRIYPLTFDNENRYLYVSSNIHRDKSAIVKLDPRTGTENQLVYSNPDYDVENLIYSHGSNKPIAAVYLDWKLRMQVLDSSALKTINLIQSQFPTLEIKVEDMDSSENRFLLKAFNDRNLGYYYLYDKSTKKTTLMADLSPWIQESKMAPLRPIQFQSRDGLPIHGYLTLPVGIKPQNLPLIVNLHAGIFSRTNWMYDRETQFFANLGYAVLQINYRGSSTYGKQFIQLSYKEWGKRIQDDITDGTLWAIHTGFIDKKRIGIYGSGFGGYCALEGLIREPKLYCCAISYSGISNLFDLLKDVSPRYNIMTHRLYEMIGDPEKDFKSIQSASPVFHVDKFKAPLFIAQGGKDHRISMNETDFFVKELKRAGVNVEYFVKPEEGRIFSKETNKIEFYNQVKQFLSQNFRKTPIF